MVLLSSFRVLVSVSIFLPLLAMTELSLKLLFKRSTVFIEVLAVVTEILEPNIFFVYLYHTLIFVGGPQALDLSANFEVL